MSQFFRGPIPTHRQLAGEIAFHRPRDQIPLRLRQAL